MAANSARVIGALGTKVSGVRPFKMPSSAMVEMAVLYQSPGANVSKDVVSGQVLLAHLVLEQPEEDSGHFGPGWMFPSGRTVPSS